MKFTSILCKNIERPITKYELDLFDKYLKDYAYIPLIIDSRIYLCSPIVENSEVSIWGYIPHELFLLEAWLKLDDVIIKLENIIIIKE